MKNTGYKTTLSALNGIVGCEVSPNLALEGFVDLRASKSAETLKGVKTGADKQWKDSFFWGSFCQTQIPS